MDLQSSSKESLFGVTFLGRFQKLILPIQRSAFPDKCQFYWYSALFFRFLKISLQISCVNDLKSHLAGIVNENPVSLLDDGKCCFSWPSQNMANYVQADIDVDVDGIE